MVVILVAWVALIVGSWGVGFQSWVFWFYLGLMDGCGYVGLAYYSTLGVILVSWVVVIMLSIIGLILATWISFGWLTQLWVLSWNNESFLDFMGGGDYTGMAYSAMKVILASWVVVIILGWLTQSWKLSWPYGWWWLYWGGLLSHESYLGHIMGGGDYTGVAYSDMKVILASWVVVIILGWLAQSSCLILVVIMSSRLDSLITTWLLVVGFAIVIL